MIAFCLALACLCLPATAETLRLVTWNVELERRGPGLLLRDILRDTDPQIATIAEVVARLAPDILLLQEVDHDRDLHAMRALRDRLARDGPHYPHILALRPNSGLYSGRDMDGDGRCCDARDAQGYGAFSGQGGMALLSRYPIDRDAVQDFSALLWRDLPGALLPVRDDGTPFPSAEARSAQRLSYTGHWVVPLMLPDGPLTLMVFHATPPVFDGPEDANGRRNHDELRFWQHFLDGAFGPAPQARFVLMGDANLDPNDSDGRRGAIRALLADPRLQDPRPMRRGPAALAPGKSGDPRLHTVDWPPPGPGPLRVSYILPSRDLRVSDAGVHWPLTEESAPAASRHRPVWVDLAMP
ncbi:endonuclease/exonuclease/phosphatase family protein [Roseovarius sp. A-2]|uniref:endonuclease/exonuclease/phosphatase family protein n=1 Tax=Roseovarius sp. A-2 TaxID=1570360 RepID=UPI0020CAA0CA|nr:endonuclease/exonuclease/phosphatase family protein [Roseovarius sp. A-2]